MGQKNHSNVFVRPFTNTFNFVLINFAWNDVKIKKWIGIKEWIKDTNAENALDLNCVCWVLYNDSD